MTSVRYRLAAFDIDGTLIGASGKLSPATIEAVGGLAAEGVAIAAATARPYELALPTLAPLGDAVTAVIAAAGADIRRATGEPLAQVALPPEAAGALARLCDRHDWRAVGGTAAGAFRRLPTPGARDPAATVASLTEADLCPDVRHRPLHGPGRPSLPRAGSARTGQGPSRRARSHQFRARDRGRHARGCGQGSGAPPPLRGARRRAGGHGRRSATRRSTCP